MARRFDWEPRHVPEGRRQIERNQRVDAAIQATNEQVKLHNQLKGRASWEESSLDKAALVAAHRRLVAAEPAEARAEAPPRQTTAEVLKQKQELRQEQAEQRVAGASTRRAQLLQRARQLREDLDAAHAAEAAAKHDEQFQRSCDELRTAVSARRGAQLAGAWQQQLAERQAADAARADEERSLAVLDQLHLQGVAEQRDAIARAGQSRKHAAMAALEQQLDEQEARGAAAGAAAARERAAQQSRWAAEEADERQRASKERERQARLAESMQAMNAWHIAEAERRGEWERDADAAALQRAQRAADEDQAREQAAAAARRAAAVTSRGLMDEEADRGAVEEAATTERLERERAAQQAARSVAPHACCCPGAAPALLLTRQVINDAAETRRWNPGRRGGGGSSRKPPPPTRRCCCGSGQSARRVRTRGSRSVRPQNPRLPAWRQSRRRTGSALFAPPSACRLTSKPRRLPRRLAATQRHRRCGTRRRRPNARRPRTRLASRRRWPGGTLFEV
jgi:colicin import membrane protein